MPINSFREDEQLSDVSKTKTLLRLFRYLLKYKMRIVVVLIIMGFCVAITLLDPLFMEAAIDKYISKGDFKGLIKLIILAGSLNICMVFAVKARMYLMATVSNKVIEEIRQELYEHIQTLDFKFFDSRPAGKILARIMGDVNSLKNVIENSVTTLIPDMVTVICVVVIMFTKNVKLAAASLFSLPIMIAWIWFIMGRAHAQWRE